MADHPDKHEWSNEPVEPPALSFIYHGLSIRSAPPKCQAYLDAVDGAVVMGNTLELQRGGQVVGFVTIPED